MIEEKIEIGFATEPIGYLDTVIIITDIKGHITVRRPETRDELEKAIKPSL